MVSPSGRVPERAPDWFFVATEAYGGRTPDLGFVLEFLGFIGVFGVEDKSRGPTRRRQGRRRTLLGGGAPTLVVVPGLPSDIFLLQYFLYFPKIFSVNFQPTLRTFISAQKQHHGSSAENSDSLG